MGERPDPLTPPGSNLASFDWFPLYYRKLVRSAFWRASTDQVCRISIELWIEAWQQTPCASLPNDDEQLAIMAGFGRRELDEWKRLKRTVMKPWMLCDDGRWYHKTLAAIANERLATREKWREKKRGQRENVSGENQGRPQGPSGDIEGTAHGRDSPLLSSPSESLHRDSVQERELNSQERVQAASRALTVVEGGKP